MLGARAVGKSSLLQQFTEQTFSQNYFPTIERTQPFELEVQGQKYELLLVDTAGQDEHSLLPDRLMVNVHGYVLVYSVTSRESLMMLQNVHDQLLTRTGLSTLPLVVVGNKIDLTSQRVVTTEEGEQMAKSLNAVHIEASAKTNTNIRRVFESMLQQMDPPVAPEQCLLL